MIRSKVLLWLAGVLIVGSVIAGWTAVGRLAAATQRGLARTEESLSSARELAADTAASAGELQRVVGIVGEGLSSTVRSLVATRQVSGNVRELLDIASIFDRVEDLTESLKQAEASIATVEIDLAEASGSIEEAVPILETAIASLRSIPDDLERSIAEVRSSRTRIGEQVWLWRLAIVACGAALVVMLLLIAQLRAAVSGRAQLETSQAQP